MAIYPGAVYKPTPHGGRVRRNRQGRGMLHVAVSRARSLPPSSSKATWHFYVALDGYCEQYVDTEFRAYGGAEGNDDQIIVETAGGTGSSRELNAEPWTPAQAARLADLMRWEASQPGGAPLELLPDARPGRRGWGPHRLGIKHSQGPRPGWWQPGSELWSSALGKECPGDAKVQQIPDVIALARGGKAITPTSEEDDNVKYKVFRSDPAQGTGPDKGTGAVALAAPGTWYVVPNPAYWELLKAYGVCEPATQQVPHNVWLYFQAVYTIPEWDDERVEAALAKLSAEEATRAAQVTGVDMDEQAFAAALAPLLPSHVGALSDEDIERIKVAVADEQARRQAA